MKLNCRNFKYDIDDEEKVAVSVEHWVMNSDRQDGAQEMTGRAEYRHQILNIRGSGAVAMLMRFVRHHFGLADSPHHTGIGTGGYYEGYAREESI